MCSSECSCHGQVRSHTFSRGVPTTCSLQDVLRSEASLITGFQSLRIPTVQWQNLLRLSGRSESVAFGLDVRNESAIVSQRLVCLCFALMRWSLLF